MYFDYIRLNFIITRATNNKNAFRRKGENVSQKNVSKTEYRIKTLERNRIKKSGTSENVQSQKQILPKVRVIHNKYNFNLSFGTILCAIHCSSLLSSILGSHSPISNKAMQMKQQLEIESNQIGYTKPIDTLHVIRIVLWNIRKFYFCIARIRSKEGPNCEEKKKPSPNTLIPVYQAASKDI